VRYSHSDLNPVAILILRAVLEEIPRGGTALIKLIKPLAKKLPRPSCGLTELFPVDEEDQRPIAYFWGANPSVRIVWCRFPAGAFFLDF